jgi:excisionase family DNA binding protein
MTNPTSPLRYSIAQAALLLNLSRSTLYERIKVGALHAHHDGRRCFIAASEIERYVKTQTGSQTSPAEVRDISP